MSHMRSHHLLALIALLIAACGGKSCACLGPIPGGFPTDSRRHENAMQVRVTGPAFDYLADNGKQLVSTLLPMGSTFNIPPSCGGANKVCCGMPQPTCSLDIGVQSVSLVPKPTSAITFTVTTSLTSKMPIPINYSIFGIGSADCLVAIDTTMSTTAHKAIDIVSDINFTVDTGTNLTNITLTGTSIKNLDPSMISLTSQKTDIFKLCGVANWGPIKGFLVGIITSTITGQIAGTVDSTFCATCTAQSDCDSFADACTGGKCQRKGKCLQEIGASGRLDFATLGSLFAATRAKLDILAVLGGYAEVPPPQGMSMGNTSGLSLGLLGGGQSAAHNPCVPMRPLPTTGMIGKWSQELSATDPGGKPYHVGFGIHESDLNMIAFGAFDGGALCLDVGTATVAQLDSGTLGIVLPSLAELTHKGDAPVYLAVRPNEEPHITLGAGTFKVDDMGKKTIDDPILHVSIPRLAIDFYALVDSRYVRVMTLNADVELPVALDVDDMGRIVPMIGDISKAFTNTTVTNSELLSESPARLATTFPALLSLAGGAVGKLTAVSLPAIMGLNLSLVGIEATDNKSFLSIFANLSLAHMDAFHASTDAQLVGVATPGTEVFQAAGGLDPAKQPRVQLLLDGVGHAGDARDLEWQVSLDDGFWSTWDSVRQLSFADPRLWLQGRHHLDVRARVAGEPQTVDANAARVEFIIDSIAPAGTVDRAGNELVMAATDRVSPAGRIEFSYQLEGGGFSPWSTESRVRLGGPVAIPVARARDEAGNVGMLEFHGRMTVPVAGGCGCSVGRRAPAESPIGSLAVVAAMALAALGRFVRRSKIVVRRNRQMLRGNNRHAPSALIGLLAFAGLASLASACDQSTPFTLGKSDQENPSAQAGRYSDAVAASGVIHVSAYVDLLGDLAYAEIPVADIGKPPLWQWVDGLPDQPTLDAMDYRKGLTDIGDDVGLYTSIALAPAAPGAGAKANATETADPRIAYFDSTHNALKFAVGVKRVFHSSFVDQPAAGGGTAGLFASLLLDDKGVASIAYMATAIPNGAGGFGSKLRLATASSADPKGPADWAITDVDTIGIPCTNLCATGQACVSTDPKDKTKSVCKPVDAAPCKAMCTATQACIAAACADILAPLKAPEYPEGTGLFASLLRAPGGLRAIVYHDRTWGDLKLAVETMPGLFKISFIDGNDPTTDVGQFAAARFDEGGTLHTAYVDAIGDRLLYKAVKVGVAAPMTPEVVDDGLRMDGPHPAGAGAALFAGGSTVRVAYQDQRLSDLWLARRDAGTWTKAALKTGATGFGFYPHLVSDANKLYATQFVYDRAAQAAGMNLGSLTVTLLP